MTENQVNKALYDDVAHSLERKINLALRALAFKLSYAKIISGHIKPNGRHMEAGVGFADKLNILQRLNPDAQFYGFDSSEGMIEVAKRKYPHLADKLQVADFCQTPLNLPYASYDSIMFFQSLPYFSYDEIEQILRNFKPYLMRGSKIIFIQTFRPESQWGQKAFSCAQYVYNQIAFKKPDMAYNNITRRELIDLLAKMNGRLVYQTSLYRRPLQRVLSDLLIFEQV